MSSWIAVAACGNDPIGRKCSYFARGDALRGPLSPSLAARHEEDFDNLGVLLLVFAPEKYTVVNVSSLSLSLSLSLFL